ncbi:MAG: 2-amino-4-hydroxy-6-hydroxymethyldihydropteridine diphosphokinase [Marinifilaceae bacterium]|nr:2-amino-4-hydroxy-6-hydroxymethyldihydropteridine diphosphokinase [Marinifilaceae bacterium]
MSVILLLGGNSGDRLANLRSALDLISERAGIIKQCSSVYETAPWGFECRDSFYNIAIELESHLDEHTLLCVLLGIEADLGRHRSMNIGYESRPMDIDIILYDDLVVDTPELQIPHPRMAIRRFVLEPIVQIAPNRVHPIVNLPMRILLERCKDELEVKKVGEIFV